MARDVRELTFHSPPLCLMGHKNVWTAFKGERDVMFWSCLNCVTNYSSDIYQFKSWYYKNRKVEIVVKIIKMVLCWTAKYLITHDTHHKYQIGRTLSLSIFEREVKNHLMLFHVDIAETCLMALNRSPLWLLDMLFFL